MDRIEIYWGADKDFEEATEKLTGEYFWWTLLITSIRLT